MARFIPNDMPAFPHWARVAFAARCARSVLPLFDQYWPNAMPSRREALHTAIGLAEESAQKGEAAAELKKAVPACVITAGAALRPTYKGFSIDEPVPADDHASHIACHVAKSAEWAAQAALEDPSESARAALEAYIWSRDAAHLAEAVDVITQLQDDFAGLWRVATRGRWSNHTAVPPRVFELLKEDPPEKPWWPPW